MKAYFREIPFDQFTPITAYFALKSQGSCILESSPGKGRFSFIGLDPIAKIEGVGDYADAVRKLMRDFPVEVDHPCALYTGGPIGTVTFENEYFFQIYRRAVIFDHDKGLAYLSTIGSEDDLDEMEKKLQKAQMMSPMNIEFGPIQTDFSDEQFAQMIEESKEHFRKGDVYQMVLSRAFSLSTNASGFDLYRTIRRASPAPYMFFFDLEEYAIVGASPEKIISVENRIVESVPIAGTLHAGESVDAFLKDAKEVSEHVMLVDLARNDVGAVSVPGSVKMLEYQKVEHFSHITHIISKIQGHLAREYDALDALQISFPAGTLSGAPKKRAKELIKEIEGKRRGLYGGGIVAMDRKGNLASCITIRTAILKDGIVTVQAGSGIVLDSDPQKEANESRLKASTILQALT